MQQKRLHKSDFSLTVYHQNGFQATTAALYFTNLKACFENGQNVFQSNILSKTKILNSRLKSLSACSQNIFHRQGQNTFSATKANLRDLLQREQESYLF